jgi:hypothetical protein
MNLMTQERLDAFHQESGGAFESMVVRPPAVLRLFARAAGGSAKASRCLLVLEQWVTGVSNARPLCLKRGCETKFGAELFPAAFVILLPLRDDPRTSLASGVCARCAAGRSDNELMLLLRQVWADLKILDALHDLPGHA